MVVVVPAEFGIGFKKSWEQVLREIEESVLSASMPQPSRLKTRGQVTRIARYTARLIGAGRELADGEIELNENYYAGTYGIPTTPPSRRCGSPPAPKA